MRIPSSPHHLGREGELFGMYHAASGTARATVLLCPPLGQVLVRTHRIYRQLATTLANQGIASLRFDYYGTGDSAGDGLALDWNRCVADVATAASELRALSGCQRVVGFGARLGGSLALEAASSAGFERLILWDPILDGSHYVARMDAMQEELRVDPLHYTQPRTVEEVANQWLGFGISAHWRAQVDAYRAAAPTVPTHVIDSLPASSPASWDVLARGGAGVTRVQPATQWEDLHRLEHAILAPVMVQAVISQLQETA